MHAYYLAQSPAPSYPVLEHCVGSFLFRFARGLQSDKEERPKRLDETGHKPMRFQKDAILARAWYVTRVRCSQRDVSVTLRDISMLGCLVVIGLGSYGGDCPGHLDS